MDFGHIDEIHHSVTDRPASFVGFLPFNSKHASEIALEELTLEL